MNEKNTVPTEALAAIGKLVAKKAIRPNPGTYIVRSTIKVHVDCVVKQSHDVEYFPAIRIPWERALAVALTLLPHEAAMAILQESILDAPMNVRPSDVDAKLAEIKRALADLTVAQRESITPSRRAGALTVTGTIDVSTLSGGVNTVEGGTDDR